MKVIASMPPGHCLGALEMLDIYNFLTGCPLPRRKWIGALALSKMKHTGLIGYIYIYRKIKTMERSPKPKVYFAFKFNKKAINLPPGHISIHFCLNK